jgi:hypothetical protein
MPATHLGALSIWTNRLDRKDFRSGSVRSFHGHPLRAWPKLFYQDAI